MEEHELSKIDFELIEDAFKALLQSRPDPMTPPMDRNLADNADYWRTRTEEARAIGVQMTDAHTRALMFSIA